MADALDLHEGEQIEKELKGDYWEKTLCFYSQKSGKYWFTNERIIFRGGFVAALDLSYSEMESPGPCKGGPLLQFLSTGNKGFMKDGKTYKLSVLKRKEVLELIQSKL